MVTADEFSELKKEIEASDAKREELIAKFLYLVKYPIQGFHGVLYNTLAGFVRVLNGVREQKEKAA